MPLTTQELLSAYASGIFPMARNAKSRALFWVNPERRGVLPLETFHVPRRLKRSIRQDIFRVRINTSFESVMDLCAEAAPDRPSTWINREIMRLYGELHREGHAHSVECFSDRELVGGLYGVSLGRAFFGESMFSRATDASKIALVHLVAHLKIKGFKLLDTQFITDHLKQFGAIEIPRRDYLELLVSVSRGVADFAGAPKELSGSEALQSISQTS